MYINLLQYLPVLSQTDGSWEPESLYSAILFLLLWHQCLASSPELTSIITDRWKLGARIIILTYYFCCHGICVRFPAHGKGLQQ